MTSYSSALNTLYDNQKRIYNLTFAELYWNVWDKFSADDGIIKFSQILGLFMMKPGGEYFEYGGCTDGKLSKLHD
jgi:hypothetical protein